MVVFEPAKGNFMFIMDSLDIVDAYVTLGGRLGYFEKMIVRKYFDNIVHDGTSRRRISF